MHNTNELNHCIKGKVLFTKPYKRLGKMHPCTGTEALYRPYGP